MCNKYVVCPFQIHSPPLNSKAGGLTQAHQTPRPLLSSPTTISAIPRRKEGRRE